MKVILQPHLEPYFGQDFTSRSLMHSMDLIPIYLNQGCYQVDERTLKQTTLIISRYPDRIEDLTFIRSVYPNIPVAVHFHLWYSFYNTQQKAVAEETMRYADLHITNCKILNTDYYKRFPYYKWHYINNGIDPAVFHPTTELERSEFRERFGIPQNRILISYVGRLNLPKGYQILEQICQFVSDSNTHWLIIQSIHLDKYDSIIEDLKARFKHITIQLSQDWRVVKYTDVCINTSLSETTSLVTLESLFAGVPIICTDSTEFYAELEFVNINFRSLFLISIPQRLKNNHDKHSLRLTRNEIIQIAEEFISEIRAVPYLDQNQRALLADRMQQSGFRSNSMIQQLHKVYDLIS